MRFKITRTERTYVEVEATSLLEAFTEGQDKLNYGYASDRNVVDEIEKIAP